VIYVSVSTRHICSQFVLYVKFSTYSHVFSYFERIDRLGMVLNMFYIMKLGFIALLLDDEEQFRRERIVLKEKCGYIST
jgi:hypothetical protein